MKRFLKAMLGLVFGAFMCVGLTGCALKFGEEATENTTNDKKIVQVYNMYVANAEDRGEEPLSYDEWLQTIKGEKGDPGRGIETVYISETFHLMVKLDDGTIIDAGYLGVTPAVQEDAYIVNGEVYFFDENHVRVNKDKEFVTINEKTYYAVDNQIVTGIQLIEDKIYDFGENGAMSEEVINNRFITIEEKTYYVVNNHIVKNYYVVDGKMYDFGDDGVLVEREFNNVFITIEEKTYYVVNNCIVKNYYIIEEKVYDFGENGVLINQEINNVFITIEEKTYYVVNNYIVKNYYIIDDRVYDFGNDGILIDREIHNEFITIERSFYFVVNNHIYKEYYLENGKTYETEGGQLIVGIVILNDKVFDFGDNGVLIDRELHNTFITVEEKTYYVVNNYIVKNYYIIEEKVYYFDNGGVLTEKEVHNEFITIEEKTYYVVNNYIVKNYYIIEEQVYDFGDDGVLIDREIHNTFITIERNVYYVINNYIVKDYYIIGDKVYNFGADGIMIRDTVLDGYIFGNDGFIVDDNTYIAINGTTYFLMNGTAVKTYSYGGTVIVSDADFNNANNEVIVDATVTITCGEYVFTCQTNAEGKFFFENLPSLQFSVVISKSSYITATYTLVHVEVTEKLIVMDMDVCNNLQGKITIADSDTNSANNQALAGVAVKLTRTSSTNAWEYETVSDSSGNYYFTDLTAGTYALTASKEGYITISQVVYVHYNQTTVFNFALEMINTPAENAYGNASGMICNVTTGLGVGGITLNVREGVNTTVGEILYTTVTDSTGNYMISQMKPGNYTIETVDERVGISEESRYGNGAVVIKILANVTIANQNGYINNNEDQLDINSMRIVLRWGATPNDLDSHLVIDRANGADDHVYYADKVGTNADLDVDDIDQYGPETTTIRKIEADTVYFFYIHNYSGGGDNVLANSGATIDIYFGASNTPTYSFPVPEGAGLYWNVFSYDAVNGFTFYNTITSTPTQG